MCGITNCMHAIQIHNPWCSKFSSSLIMIKQNLAVDNHINIVCSLCKYFVRFLFFQYTWLLNLNLFNFLHRTYALISFSNESKKSFSNIPVCFMHVSWCYVYDHMNMYLNQVLLKVKRDGKGEYTSAAYKKYKNQLK
jgi:hypothetical protein